MTVVTCIVSTDEAPCPQPPVVARPVGLCKQHAAEVAAALLPKILKESLQYMVATAAAEADGWSDETSFVDEARSLPVASVLGGPHRPVVYIVQNGDRVKIGTSRNLHARMQSLSLRPHDVLCVLDGDRVLERAVHRRFFTDRIGSTEWFEPGEELSLFIKSRAAQAASPGLAVDRESRPLSECPMSPLRFPNGTQVGRDQWPDLYRLFAASPDGATKKELAQTAGVSRDTAMRAIDEWTRHGVRERRDGRSTRYYLPKEA